MDKKYIELFKNLAQASAATAEQVMDYDRQKNDEKGLKTATIMRDDFQELAGRVDTPDYIINKSDATKFLVAAMIQVNQLQDRIENLKRAMTGYQTDVIPKLQAVIESETEETAAQIAEEKFVLESNE